ncbi:MAG TPA: BTAD domain-containing putative transcriptional regulator [Solirubrobacteraceae bacterium]
MGRPTPSDVTIKLFGPLKITIGEHQIGAGDLGGIRPKQVLEILLAARGHPVPTDRLADLLWGQELPLNAANSLQTFISALRRHLSSDREWARALVVTDAQAYRFDTELVTLDLDRFDALLEHPARQSSCVVRSRLEHALALVRGEVLDDEPYAKWAFELRRIYQARVLEARVDAAKMALGECDYSAALRHAENAIGMDRFSEQAHRLAMLALYALGRQHEALHTFTQLRTVLDQELGLEPTPDTRALHSAILRQDDPISLIPRPPQRGGASQARHAPVVLLGRVSERARLESVTRRALDGTFALTLVEGEAGLGKSRLLDELVASLEGVRIGRSSCSELERHLPYVPLATAIRDALRDLMPEPGSLPALREILPELRLGSEDRPFAEVDALEALVQLVEANAPLVLLLDDLQWADASTLGALAYMQRRCVALPVAVVGTLRSGEVPDGDPVRRLAPSAVVRLEPLTPGELAPLGILRLHERTGGNPRFVAAAVRGGGAGELEQTISETLLAQCRAEGTVACRLLIWASVLGEPFDPDEVSTLAGVDPLRVTEEFDRLCGRQILCVDGIRFRFRYSIFRDVLLHSISPARRRVMCERVTSARREREFGQAEPQPVPLAR